MNRTAKAFLALTAAVHVALAAWIRRDARARDADASPWDLLTALTGVFGLAGYLRTRRRAN
ncbi:hypothetical protein [Halopelagius longus]|uniref:Uncharacterized protein n=1 Tax=Halopelagius longus TaxID=1236180 RepID=A0A1H0XT11_9EURY|nr:hypothetical protein [Halopelagius longus]RDI72074.1 hypothetical protein DWB78_10275 [Halopelagius longus]SDQ06044.1 hypothetical protein SAMN05216278_0163 [Halopelagius longus]